jgi:hypothetical protein
MDDAPFGEPRDLPAISSAALQPHGCGNAYSSGWFRFGLILIVPEPQREPQILLQIPTDEHRLGHRSAVDLRSAGQSSPSPSAWQASQLATAVVLPQTRV